MAGGGSLDMKELKQALKRMMDAYTQRLRVGAAATATATLLRERSSRLRAGALAAARACEAACTTLRAARGDSSVGSELGDIISGKGMKAADVAKKWDTSGDGEIDKKEVRVAGSNP